MFFIRDLHRGSRDMGVDELIYYMFSQKHSEKPPAGRIYPTVYIGGDYGQQNATTFQAFGLDTYNFLIWGESYQIKRQ